MTTVIGREHDAARVRQALEHNNVCALIGPGGVGKSALVGELIAPLGEGGLLVDVRAVDRPEVVLARIAEAIFADHVIDVRNGDAERLCVALAGRLAASDVNMLVVDHAEHRIETVFDLLAKVAQRAPGVSIVIASRVQPVRSSVQTVRLPPLDIVTMDKNAESTGMVLFRQAFLHAGGNPDALETELDAVQRLLAETGGLPLAIIVTAARAAMIGAQNALTDEEPTDPLIGDTTDGDPVGSVLAQSLHGLDSTSLDAFETIGAFRNDVSIDHIAWVCSIEGNAATSAVGRLARRSLVTVDRGGVTMLPPVRQLAIRHAKRRRRSTWLEQRHSAWALEVCQAEPALGTSQIGAIEDDLVSAIAVALREAQLDSACVIATVVDDAFRADLRHRRRLEVLEPLVIACEAASSRGSDGDQFIDTTIEMMRLTAIARADALGWSSASPLLERAAALVPRSQQSSRHGARIESLRAAFWFESGDLATARRAATAGIEAGRASGDALALHKSMKLLADAELDSGHVEQALRLAHEVVQSVPTQLGWLRSYALAQVAMCELERGGTAVVLATAQRLTDEAAKDGNIDLIVEADWLTAMAAPAHGRRISHDLSGERAGNSIIHIQADIAQAIRRLADGDAHAAITLAADCEVRAGVLPMRSLAIDAQLLVGSAAIELGEAAEARRAFAKALTEGFTHGYRLRVPDALDGLAAVIAMQAGTTARQHNLRTAAATIRTQLAVVARPRPWRRDAVVTPAEHPPEGWVADGSLTAAGFQGAMRALAQLDGARASPKRSLGLSPAEQVVANLVADGCTNREIGERLHVSRRTVESHIAHAFQKLNVTSRTQLAAIVLADRVRPESSGRP
ncbi:MAG: helix-turn-helix transcriptional regulator [Acidimicrobiales bacterium]